MIMKWVLRQYDRKVERFYILVASILIWILPSCSMESNVPSTLSPLDFGFSQAQTGIQRFEVLQKTHSEALKRKLCVSYKGIHSIDLEIPPKAKSIPLNGDVDFSGVSINVTNTVKDFFLFELTNDLQSIALNAKDIDEGNFTSNSILKQGLFLVLIKDSCSWVERRRGYAYGHYRKDMLLVKNGRSLNHTIMPYDNFYSKPLCEYRLVSEKQTVIKNLKFNRSKLSTKKTKLFNITNQNNILIKNIEVYTPKNSSLKADGVISVSNSTNVFFEDIKVDGTYSLSNYYGYAFELDNIWNLKGERIVADGAWGVFGNNNLNSVKLADCKINRFDVHCYGRDVVFENCVFFDLYNQFSSTFGSVRFHKCVFEDCIPFLYEYSYNAFVPVDIIFKDCKVNFGKGRNYLVQVKGLSDVVNPRHELSKKSLPNVMMDDCEVIVDSHDTGWNVISMPEMQYSGLLYYISKIRLKNVRSNVRATQVNVFPNNIKTLSPIDISVDVQKIR